MDIVSIVISRILGFILVFLLFGGLPALFFHPKMLEASAKSIPVSPWEDWRDKSPLFFKKLAWSIRMPFLAFALSVATHAVFPGKLHDMSIGIALALGAIAGITYYLRGPE